MFTDFKAAGNRPLYVQVKQYIKQMITEGILRTAQKLPSTRELGSILGVSRNTIIAAYAELEDEGYIYTVKGKGAFVSHAGIAAAASWNVDWTEMLSDRARLAEELDLMKHGIRWEKGMIAFTSIAPDEKLFDLNGFRRAFLDRMAVEGEKILNYGYAKGYRPLIEYLRQYMRNKGVDLTGKDMLITNGFTEGFDIVLSALSRKSGRIVCENPTHNTAIKMMKLHGFEIDGIEMEPDGIHLGKLEQALAERKADMAFLIPSYHNPTGIVMSPEKRMGVLRILAKYRVPVVEDGFNEELRYSGSHAGPLIASSGSGNNVIYIGSFSKVLFPGIRVGWILADKELVDYLESVKRARTIHTSTLDQAVLYQYLYNGNFAKYMKKARMIYKRKYELAVRCVKESIPLKRMSGDGGLHLFVELEDGIRSRDVLELCYEKGVVFTPGDVFYTDRSGSNTLRLGFSRVADEEIARGIRAIGEVVQQLY